MINNLTTQYFTPGDYNKVIIVYVYKVRLVRILKFYITVLTAQ